MRIIKISLLLLGIICFQTFASDLPQQSEQRGDQYTFAGMLTGTFNVTVTNNGYSTTTTQTGANPRLDPVLLDFFTTPSNTYTIAGGTPRTYIGEPVALASSASPITITSIDVYVASVTTASYTSVQLNMMIWDQWQASPSPVFSDGSFVQVNLGGANFTAGNLYGVNIELDPPVEVTDANTLGFAFNWKGNTGSGLQDTDNLTTALRHTDPFAVGTNLFPAPEYGYYRNASGRTDLNFNSDDARKLDGLINTGVVFVVYGIDGSIPTNTPTPTATNVDTATSTVVPTSTETETPTTTPEPTTEEPYELLQNGSFELDSDGDKIPDGWIGKNLTKDKHKCNQPEKIIAREGECAFMFKGSMGENSKLSQAINPDDFDLITHDGLVFMGWYNAKSGTDAKVKVRVAYADTSLEKGKFTASLSPTMDYAPILGEVTLLNGDITKIKVSISNKSETGKMYLDALEFVRLR